MANDDMSIEDHGFDTEAIAQLAAIAPPLGTSIVPDDSDRDHVWQQIAAKTWDDLGVREYDGRLWFPVKGWRRNAVTGNFEEVACMMAAPEGFELRASRVMARKLAKEEGLDWSDKDDRKLCGDLEDLCILWHVIRDVEPAPIKDNLAMDPRDLEKRFTRPCIEYLWAMCHQLRRIIDPRLAGMTEEELITVTAAIVARNNLAPLVAFDTATQERFIVTMAVLYQIFVTLKSSPGSAAHSTPAPST
jgi:hypothetical protein